VFFELIVNYEPIRFFFLDQDRFFKFYGPE
jgi:hypothetical protein